MTLVIAIVLVAATIAMVPAYRTGYRVGLTDRVAAAALGFNVAAAWGFALTALGVVYWGTGSIIPLIAVSLLVTALSSLFMVYLVNKQNSKIVH